jgi:hypothetical protein
VKGWWLRNNNAAVAGTTAARPEQHNSNNLNKAVDIAVRYGRVWSAADYAQLILHPWPHAVATDSSSSSNANTNSSNSSSSSSSSSGSSSSAHQEVAEYAAALQHAGVQTVANGFLFGWMRDSSADKHHRHTNNSSNNSSSSVSVSVQKEVAELWQQTALLPCALPLPDNSSSLHSNSVATTDRSSSGTNDSALLKRLCSMH